MQEENLLNISIPRARVKTTVDSTPVELQIDYELEKNKEDLWYLVGSVSYDGKTKEDKLLVESEEVMDILDDSLSIDEYLQDEQFQNHQKQLAERIAVSLLSEEGLNTNRERVNIELESYILQQHIVQTKGDNLLTTIYGMLRNRAYIGEMIWNRTNKKGKPKPQEKWIVKENAFKSIVDKNTFEQVQIMLDARKRRYFEINAGGRKPSNKYLLSSVMVCASCGHHYAGHTYGKVKNGKKRFYWCSGYKTKGRYFCKWFPISANWIEDELFREIYLRLNSPELINLIVGKLNSRLNTQEQITADRLKEMGKALTKVDTELSRLIRVIKETDRSPQSIVDEISSLEGEKAQLLMEKEEIKLSNTPQKDVTKENIMPILADIEGLLRRNASPSEKSKFVESFIPRVDIYPYDKTVTHLTLKPSNNIFQWYMAVPGFEPGFHG